MRILPTLAPLSHSVYLLYTRLLSPKHTDHLKISFKALRSLGNLFQGTRITLNSLDTPLYSNALGLAHKLPRRTNRPIGHKSSSRANRPVRHKMPHWAYFESTHLPNIFKTTYWLITDHFIISINQGTLC